MPFKEVQGLELEFLVESQDIDEFMLLYHLTDCPPCKQVLPEFANAGQASTLQWFSIESNEVKQSPVLMNSTPHVTSFPTVVYFSNSEKHCIKFTERYRTKENLTAFSEKCRKSCSCKREEDLVREIELRRRNES